MFASEGSSSTIKIMVIPLFLFLLLIVAGFWQRYDHFQAAQR
ncbi:hypothetical protein JCM19239_2174 [Vibrio variabilis]|uniref:Uncharacterized protein n=1 Tax=Vibrio variabilis TaxID=990271 RepID=A0ABQ0JRT6_9VIBR|nr:hypothetical protein JCM19239_2174 [Vibrio variabilis]